ncbi:hypothetical protein DH2020_042196 [Rehmannia glutinosa]|uniref:Protein TIFY n=1 Tax=Rehmannia glutinosa TaxID=99300 RepID=A0ABR0UQ45_REHGL
MKRNCNLELRLVTPSVFSHSSDYNDRNHSMYDIEGSGSPNKKQQLTIFYNGRVASCDATELQARTIIFLASKEMEEKSNNSPGSDPCSPVLHSPTTNLSMKRSLQRFLEKRKTRAQAMSPYPINYRHQNGNN